MTESETIFRSYFEDEESLLAFMLAHKVQRGVKDGVGNGIAVDLTEIPTTLGKMKRPRSFADKPAYVGWFLNHSKGIVKDVVWVGSDGQLHRDNGPARIVTYKSRRTVRYWYRNGRRVAAP